MPTNRNQRRHFQPTRIPSNGLWTLHPERFCEFGEDEVLIPEWNASTSRLREADPAQPPWSQLCDEYARALDALAPAQRWSWPWYSAPVLAYTTERAPLDPATARFWFLAACQPGCAQDEPAAHPGLEQLRALGDDEPWPDAQRCAELLQSLVEQTQQQLTTRFRWFLLAPITSLLCAWLPLPQVLKLLDHCIPEPERAPFDELLFSFDEAQLNAASVQLEDQLLTTPLHDEAQCIIVASRLAGFEATKPTLEHILGAACALPTCAADLARSVAALFEDEDDFARAYRALPFLVSPELVPWLIQRAGFDALDVFMAQLYEQPHLWMSYLPMINRIHCPQLVVGFMMMAITAGPCQRAARAWLISEGANALAIAQLITRDGADSDLLLIAPEQARQNLVRLAELLIEEYAARGHQALVDSAQLTQ